MELDAARVRLRAARRGARPGARGALISAGEPPVTRRADAREVEVLRLVAAGKTNRAIAAELVHQREDRGPPREQHLHQAGLSSRAAATAYAYEHGLV